MYCCEEEWKTITSVCDLSFISLFCSVTGTVWVKTTQLASHAAESKALALLLGYALSYDSHHCKKSLFYSVRVAGELSSVY